jgi:hypothetical protein
MPTKSLTCVSIAAAAALFGGGCGGDDSRTTTQAESGSTGATGIHAQEFSFSDPTKIDNPYAPLTEFERCTLEGESEGEKEKVVRTLLDETKTFTYEGEEIEVAVIEDRNFTEGELVELTLDYFGQSDDGTVHYFGEDVKNYENGKLTDTEGSFLYGKDTDFLGILMPADPQVGDQWKFENAPPITVESDTVKKELPQAKVGGKTYKDVIVVEERIQPDDEIEDKLYARGIGNIQELPPDGEAHLVKCV